MPGLIDLSQKEVENVFSYTLQKIKTDDLLDAFKGTLKQLYDVEDYKGGWQSNAMYAAANNYIAKTDAIKKDYKDKRITHIAASSVNIVGGILSFTPFAPIGWGLLGLGTATNAATDVVDLLDRSKQNDWNSAKDALKNFVENPFQGTTFELVYQSLMTTYAKIRNFVATDDYSILLQGLGWNYFVFRKGGKSHEEAIQQLKTTLEFFRTHRYTISTDLKLGKQNAIQDIQNQIKPSFQNLAANVGALAMIGLAAGISISAITAGINIASATFKFAEPLARGLLAIGNFAARALDVMLKAGPVVAIVGGVLSVVFEAIALANIDETFKPYYDFKDECVKLLDEYKIEYEKNDAIIVEMIKFMKETKVIQLA